MLYFFDSPLRTVYQPHCLALPCSLATVIRFGIFFIRPSKHCSKLWWEKLQVFYEFLVMNQHKVKQREMAKGLRAEAQSLERSRLEKHLTDA